MKDLSCQLDIPWITKSLGFNVLDMKLSSEIEKQGRPVAKSAEPIPKLFLAFFWTDCPTCDVILVKTRYMEVERVTASQLQLQEHIFCNVSPL